MSTKKNDKQRGADESVDDVQRYGWHSLVDVLTFLTSYRPDIQLLSRSPRERPLASCVTLRLERDALRDIFCANRILHVRFPFFEAIKVPRRMR